MSDLESFGTEEHPLRCSQLPLLMKCPWRAVAMFLGIYEDSSGPSADTGSAVHKAVEQWHASGNDYKKALKAMKEAAADYPLADFHEAELHFRPYTKDPRNQQAEIVASEEKVEFCVEDVWFRGTFDQIRKEGGQYKLYDLKTGQTDGYAMLHEYLYQQAGYVVGANGAFREPVLPGGLIRTRGYRTRANKGNASPPDVFWRYDWLSIETCHSLMKQVVKQVQQIRSGVVRPGPGEHCYRMCPAKGLDNCLPKYLELEVLRGVQV